MPQAASSKTVILKKEDEKEVIQALCSLIEAKSEAALSVSATATFHLGLSGGSLAKFLISGLSSIKTDWARWRLFFCDERLVPAEDGDSTWGLYRWDVFTKKVKNIIRQMDKLRTCGYSRNY